MHTDVDPFRENLRDVANYRIVVLYSSLSLALPLFLYLEVYPTEYESRGRARSSNIVGSHMVICVIRRATRSARCCCCRCRCQYYDDDTGIRIGSNNII